LEENAIVKRGVFMKVEKADKIDINKFNFLRFFRLLPKKIDERYKKYAGLNRRTMAATIDTFIAMFTIAPVMDWVLGHFIHSRDVSLEEISKAVTQTSAVTQIIELVKLHIDSGKMSEFLLQMLALLLASAICWKLWSATPGKILLGMKILDAETEKPMTNRQIIVRSLGYIPACCIFFLGIIWISFNKRGQGWHDKMAGTVVIITSKNKTKEISKELP
jgi:uncharacterized RDD family membrane protein YckC